MFFLSKQKIKKAQNREWKNLQPGPEVIKRFSCSTQQSMNFVLLINLQLLTIANSFLLNIAEHEHFSANKYENAINSYEHENFSANKYEKAFLYLLAENISCSVDLSMKNVL